MKGLLLKDWYMMKEYCKSYILITLVFIVVGVSGTANMFMLVFPSVLMALIPVTLISLEEKCRWNVYCDVLPDSRRRAVSEKYLLTVLLEGIILFFNALAQGISMISRGSFTWGRYAGVLSLIVVSGLLGAALMLPPVFKYGAEKGKSIYMAVYFLFVAFWSVVAVRQVLRLGANAAETPFGWGIFLALGICSAAVFAGSWVLSLRIYRKREI